MTESFVYDDPEVEIPVSIRGVAYVLKEASGDAAAKYRNACLRATRVGKDGKFSAVDGIADVEPLLVSLCLFTQEGKRVSDSVVRGFPSKAVKALFDKAKEISGLNEVSNKDTIESLTKQRDVIEGKLHKLQQVDTASGNLSEPTTNGLE